MLIPLKNILQDQQSFAQLCNNIQTPEKETTMTHSVQNKKETLLEVQEPEILMPFLLSQLKQKSRDNIKSLLKNRQVVVNGESISQFNHRLKPGDKVTVRWEKTADGNISNNLQIIYEDEHIIVIEKHAGLLSIATESGNFATAYSILSSYVKQQKPTNKIFIVHRLDRDTSGVMMFARSEKVQSLLQKNWKENVKQRTYSVLVEGKVEEQEGTLKSYIYESKSLMMHSTQDSDKGEMAITHFRTIKTNNKYSLLEANLDTGKKNQIRLHMQDMGHSVVGDKKYGAKGNPIGRLGLHASLLEFIHPVTGKVLRFESKIPAKFRLLV